MKICSKCKVEKQEDQFYKNKSKIDGLQSSCKECFSKRMETYRQNNKDKIQAGSKRYHEENRHKIKQKNKGYYAEKREELKEKSRVYRRENKSKVTGYAKKYRSENKEVLKERGHNYFQKIKNDLTDSYIKKRIYKYTGGVVKSNDIPTDVIELERLQIILTKSIKNEQKSRIHE